MFYNAILYYQSSIFCQINIFKIKMLLYLNQKTEKKIIINVLNLSYLEQCNVNYVYVYSTLQLLFLSFSPFSPHPKTPLNYRYVFIRLFEIGSNKRDTKEADEKLKIRFSFSLFRNLRTPCVVSSSPVCIPAIQSSYIRCSLNLRNHDDPKREQISTYSANASK